MDEKELHIGHVVADPLGDVLEWLGHYRPKDGEFQEGYESVREPLLEATGESQVGTATVNSNAHAARVMRPKMDGQRMGPGAYGASPNSGPGLTAASSSTVAVGGAALGSAAMDGSALAKASSTAAGRDGKKCCDAEGGGTGAMCSAPDRKDLVEEEEQEWEMRQRRSGTVGRLVTYGKTDRPGEDVVLRGGGRRHVVVAGVRESGQASRAGVKAGDRLVSINGQKDFRGLSADTVRDNLAAPCVLVFLGFVGKLQAEVRLTAPDEICGFGSKTSVLCTSKKDAPVQLCEERVFNVGIASLFLTSAAERAASRQMAQDQQPLFELRRKEASGLLRSVLSRVEVTEAASPRPLQQTTGLEASDAGRTPPREPSSASPSPTARATRELSAVSPWPDSVDLDILTPAPAKADSPRMGQPTDTPPVLPPSPPPMLRPPAPLEDVQWSPSAPLVADVKPFPAVPWGAAEQRPETPSRSEPSLASSPASRNHPASDMLP